MHQLPKMIDYYRKEQDLTLEDLGKKLDKSKSAISRWISGDRSPMVDDLVKLADIFQVPVTNLLFGPRTSELATPQTKKRVTISKTTSQLLQAIKTMTLDEQKETLDFALDLLKERSALRFPVIVTEALAAGRGYAYDNDRKTVRYTSRDDLKPYDLASAVSGDSMEPMLQDGDVVLIKKNVDFISGGVYAVDYNEKAYVKKVYFEKDNLRLVSLNDKYEDIIIPRDTDHYLNIVGLIVDWFSPVQD